MTRSLIVAEREFTRLIKGRGGKIALACAAAAAAAELAARHGPLPASASGRLGADLSRLDLMLSSLVACLVAALSFSAEELGGTAALLRSIGLSRGEYFAGKYLGAALWSTAAAAAAIVLAAVLADPYVGASSLAILVLSAACAAAVYSAWGAFFGGAGQSALSAAGSALAFWLVTVFAYEAVGWALLPALPYRIAKPTLAAFLALDPAEALRVGAIFLSGSGSVFGPEFYYWQRFFSGTVGILCALGLLIAHITLPASLAIAASRRRS